jgi:RIO kinase 1
MTDDDELEPRLERRRERRAARKRNDGNELQPNPPDASRPETDRFAASVQVTKAERAWIREHLGPLHERDLIDDVLRRVQAGKEATVYACSGGPAAGAALVAAKLYRAKSLRGERNAGHYQQGRDVLAPDGRAIGPRAWRLRKAIAQKSRVGRKAAQSSWLMHEFSILQALSARGADVPRPIEYSDFAFLMEFIGHGLDAAPALHQVTLTWSEARPLFERVLFNVDLLLELGWVHGDLSAHNLLYHEGRAILIDFPQVVALHGNPEAHAFLERDLRRIVQYFERAGVRADGERLLRQLWSKHANAQAGEADLD